jgi:hypothetical protein
VNREDQKRDEEKIPSPSHFTLGELIARLEEEPDLTTRRRGWSGRKASRLARRSVRCC